jgi:hypothetical protein
MTIAEEDEEIAELLASVETMLGFSLENDDGAVATLVLMRGKTHAQVGVVIKHDDPVVLRKMIAEAPGQVLEWSTRMLEKLQEDAHSQN